MEDNIKCKSDSGYFDVKIMPITDREFRLLRTLIYDHFGISLSDKKRGFIVSRLQKLLRTENYKSFEEYYNCIISDKSGKELSKLATFISTNFTFFNREKEHFEFFYNTVLPTIAQQLKAERKNDIRIWCAGCSSGEEPYMLAMLMFEFFGDDYFFWDAGVLATDISTHALTIAHDGIYSEEQVSLLPKLLKVKYFQQIDNDRWQIVKKIRDEVTFRQFNLMNGEFPFRKPFQVIFCRNVMIYFDQVTRDALVRRFYQFTRRNGYLFIGHSESLPRETTPYQYVMPALYMRR